VGLVLPGSLADERGLSGGACGLGVAYLFYTLIQKVRAYD